MALKVCVFEDSKISQFYPLTYLRPAYLLRVGIFPMFDTIRRQFPDSELSFASRDSLAPLVAEDQKEFAVNIIKRDDEKTDEVLFVNGRIRDFADLKKQVDQARLSTVYKAGADIAAVLFKPDSLTDLPKLATPKDFLARYLVEKEDIPEFECKAAFYEYPWELVAGIGQSVTRDFEVVRAKGNGGLDYQIDPAAHLINKDNVIIRPGAHIKAGAVIDASKGPVYIGPNTRVESQAAIYGPTSIGPNCVVLAGKIESCSIGHTCRVGGELEESVLQSYVNKYHAGFIGHSYVGSWVNFGAMTTNSDLKNNYSSIRVSLNGEMIDTGLIKVGSFIGDHTKTGIGTLLNTGINIGICCNIFGGGLTTDKEVPSFSWGNTGSFESYKIEKALETARRTAERRNHTLSVSQEKRLQEVFEKKESTEGILDFS